ncbi:MAG TPA: HAMP domain-containing sensor histidine kinase [Verrucomicrobiae bacterium]|nr:HAMP domain-containing sensor histidine kinase [Verrucomicrobiae bacterium]
MSLAPNRRDALRGSGLMILLVAGLVLAGVLAWQAADAARSHQDATAAVLRDYAGLAGTEFVRRSSALVGYEGCFRLVTAIRQATPPLSPGSAAARDQVATQDEVAARLDANTRRALDLATRYLRFHAASGRLAATDPLPEALSQKLAGRLGEASGRSASGRGAFTTIQLNDEGTARAFVVAPIEAAPARGGESAPADLVGFELNLDALTPWFQQVLQRAPLLPPSISHGKVGNDRLTVEVVDASGRTRFRSGALTYGGFGEEIPFGDAYDGVFEGMRLRVSLNAAAAPALVIGGLPRSRLPQLLVLLVVAAGLTAAGLVLLRRERAVAAMRTEFVSRVSHELRTPLTQIRMFSETLLLDRVRTDGERRRALQIIDDEARRLGHLVENVLQFARGERGALQLDLQRRDLGALIRETVEGFEPMARRAGAAVESRFTGDLTARLDTGALRQVLLNLLDNAVKYGPEGQRIRVEAERLDGVCRIRVEDQGPGIPAGERDRIWEPFQRLRREETAAVAGTGIGLSVVRELTDLQGGRCWVEERPEGGARFVVELPAAGTDA